MAMEAGARRREVVAEGGDGDFFEWGAGGGVGLRGGRGSGEGGRGASASRSVMSVLRLSSFLLRQKRSKKGDRD